MHERRKMATKEQKEQFIVVLAPLVQKYAIQYGYSVVSPIIAQFCKESAFGTSELAKNANNFVGLKFKPDRCPSAWATPYYKKGTEQLLDGSYLESTMKWFQFDNLEQCVNGYFEFISISRYDNLRAVNGNAKLYCNLLHEDGYATSLSYATSLYNDYIVKYGLLPYDDFCYQKKEENTMNKIKIMLDAGHDGKRNQSPVLKSYYESEAMWKLHNYVKDALTREGFEVGVTRKTLNESKDVVARGTASKGYDLFLSLHSNACGTESVDRPVGIYLATDNTTDIDEKSKDLADRLTKVCKTVIGTSQNPQIYEKLAGYDRNGNGNLKDDDYYGVLYGAHKVGTPAVILEHSFHTNLKAAKWLSVDANLKKLAEEEVKVLVQYFGLQTAKPVEPQIVETAAETYTATKYIVKSGDTLGAIAKKMGTTVDEIMSLNPQISNPNKIYPKQEIIVSVNGVDFFVNLKTGDPIRLKDNSTYYNGKSIPAWVKKSKLYYRGENKNGVIFSILKIGAITGTTKKEFVLPY